MAGYHVWNKIIVAPLSRDKTEMGGMEQPLYYWFLSIAQCGMAFVLLTNTRIGKGQFIGSALKISIFGRLRT